MSILDNVKALVEPLVFKKDGSVSCGFGVRIQMSVILDRENWIKIEDGIKTIEAELARLRAANEELKANVLLLQTEYLRQNPFEDPQDTIDELEREVERLRAELTAKEEALKGAEREIGYMKGQRKVLKDKINDIAGDAARNLVDATAQNDENKRLRAVNAELGR